MSDGTAEAEVAVEQTADGSTEAAAAPEETTTEEGAGEKAEDGADATSDATSEAKPAEDTTDAQKKDTGLSGTVAKHYNDLKEGTVQDRFKSRIYFQRNFNNWIKSMLIANSLKAVHRKKGCTVLDLCCGKGGDLLKWTKGNIKKLVGADIAEMSVQQCRRRYTDMRDRNRRMGNQKTFDAEFITADCAKVVLADFYKDKDIQFDLCSCQFSFHYSFETATRARTMLRNACERLRPGGYFIGTIPNAYELVSRLKASEDLSFGNEVYKVTFANKDEFPLFGCKYDFHLEGVVDCPEFLIYFPLLEEMAKEFDMELVFFKKFQDIFDENYENDDNQALITKMQALEQYPHADFTTLASKREDDYAHAEARRMELTGLATEGDKKPVTIGTLSKSEWEASSIYCAFAFKKAGEIEEEAEEEPAKEESKPAEVTNGNGTEAAVAATEEEGAGQEEGDGAEAQAEEEDAGGQGGEEGEGEAAAME